MNSKRITKLIAAAVAAAITAGVLAACAPEDPQPGGTGGAKPEALIVMTEELNGLYNPFYSSAGTDMDVVGQTQLSMLSTDSSGHVSFGNDEPTVVLNYDMKTTNEGSQTYSDYYFVLKKGLKFSDGKPLTMNDVMFNLYVYLDPAYAGSSTMYSTKIDGLQRYRTQQNISGDSSAQDTELTRSANTLMMRRVQVLLDIYYSHDQRTGSAVTHSANIDTMHSTISTWTFNGNTESRDNYLKTFLSNSDLAKLDDAARTDRARKQLRADYDSLVGTDTTLQNGMPVFGQDPGKYYDALVIDYNSSKTAYTEEPYKSSPTPFDEIVSFMYTEGFVSLTYTDPAKKDKIKTVSLDYPKTITTMDAAIKHVWQSRVLSNFDSVLQGTSAGSDLMNEFVSQGKDVALHNLSGDSVDGSLKYPNISGVRSLAADHLPAGESQSTYGVTNGKISVGGTEYDVAASHNEDGTPTSGYDVLRIRVVGTDPKAIWNFGFTVAPYHYYSNPSDPDLGIDIKENKFGVKWASFDFQSGVLQGDNTRGVSKNKVPLGAGPYVATDVNNNDNPSANGFFNSNFVYYKANENFSLDGEHSSAPKIKKMRYQVVSSYNALTNLENGAVHFVEPQFTKENSDEVERLKKQGGFDSVSTWNLGYGYIGINAGKIKNINLRKAIMAAMNVATAKEYYLASTVETIRWPMSLMSWAYPRTASIDDIDYDHPLNDVVKPDANRFDYLYYMSRESAKSKIQRYTAAAGNVSSSDLTVTFTIAGSQLTEHPCYQVFKDAMDLLNECGWNVSVSPDTYALTKLSTGSLAVWAAAWGSTIDPDMYQVYHKNSTATSTLAWGYREILASPTSYVKENEILTSLATVIDDARETNNETTRRSLYKTAMEYVLDLAVELPVYQRQVLFAFNTNVIDVNTLPHDTDGKLLINAYTSPLSRIWEVDFVK